jgi:hypothetical protein
MPTRPTAPGLVRTPNRARRGWAHLFHATLSAIVILVTLELSGLAARAVEMVCDGESVGDCCSDCPVDQGGQECPPGCPSCHCAHATTALPTATGDQMSVVDSRQGVCFRPYEATVPRSTDLRRIYRPPRRSSIA